MNITLDKPKDEKYLQKKYLKRFRVSDLTTYNHLANENLENPEYCQKKAERLFNEMARLPHGIYKKLLKIIIVSASRAYPEFRITHKIEELKNGR